MTMPQGPGSQTPYPPPPGPPAGPYQQYPGGSPGGFPPPGPEGYTPTPGQPGYAAPPKRRSRTGIVALLVLLGLVIVIVGGLYVFRDRISGDVNSLVIGDCIDEPSSATSITDVQHQPCTDPHDGEVFALITYPGDSSAPYPGASAFDDAVTQQCLPAVATYTGRSLTEVDAAGLSYAYFYPTTNSWSNGDRGVTCYIAKADGSKLVGSLRAPTPSKTP